jgi:hypothetical protein
VAETWMKGDSELQLSGQLQYYDSTEEAVVERTTTSKQVIQIILFAYVLWYYGYALV